MNQTVYKWFLSLIWFNINCCEWKEDCASILWVCVVCCVFFCDFNENLWNNGKHKNSKSFTKNNYPSFFLSVIVHSFWLRNLLTKCIIQNWTHIFIFNKNFHFVTNQVSIAHFAPKKNSLSTLKIKFKKLINDKIINKIKL